ncbi:MAG: amidase [Phycisphaerae bacterium]|nr:amidase [Phycisphaerae bacterium]
MTLENRSDEAGSPDTGEGTAGPITPAMLEAAERLAGINFTDAERRTIADTMDEQVGIFARRVKMGELPNDLAPALVFRALPPGRALDPVTSTGDPGLIVGKAGPCPADETDIAFASIGELATWIRRGDLTSERLTDIYLRRIDRLDPELHCMITVTADRARRQARAADAALAAGEDRGPLHGIPYGAKDIVDVEGIRATWGAAPFRDRVASTTATVIERLDAHHAVMLGKTAVGALAYGDIWFDEKCRNPWNLEQGSSGSSAGSASGTAAGLMAFSLGSETYGSIVSPCVRCGATGLRPTFGRVSKAGVMSLCWSLDKIGPITRRTVDTAYVLAAIQGLDPRDPSSVGVPFASDPERPIEGLRIGWNPAWFESAGDADRAVLDHLRRSGCRMVEVDLPTLPWESLLVPLYAESAAAFESLTRDDRDDEMVWQAPEAWPNTFRRSWFIPAVEAVQSDRVRRMAMNAMAEVMEKVDALALPPFAAGLLLITNATGHPTLVLPTSEDGSTPSGGFTFIGRLFDEGTLIRLGRSVEQGLSPRTLRPPLG